MPTKPFPPSSKPVPPTSGAALALQVINGVVEVVALRTAHSDRCHQREQLVRVYLAQLTAQDRREERAFNLLDRHLEIASALARGGHVETALDVLRIGHEALAMLPAAAPKMPLLPGFGGRP